MEIFLIFIFLRVLILENAIGQIEAGKIKQEKSFAEIFGQRWAERTEENIYPIDQIIYRENADQNNQFGHNHQQIDENFHENIKVKEESATNCDQLEQLRTNAEQISDHFPNAIDKKKREIVEKFHKIKEKVKQMGKKCSTKEWQKIEIKISKKLGANRKKIYEWKRKFGMIKKHYYTDDEKYKIVKQFDQLYEKIKIKFHEKLEGNREKCQKILAKYLGIDISTIYKWKKQLTTENSVKNQKTADEKSEIVEKYLKIKNKFMKNGKHSQKEWKEFYEKIKQMIGVSHMTIERWAEKLNSNQNTPKKRKSYTIAEKMEFATQFFQMKNQNPKLSDRKIAQTLNIPLFSLRRYKPEFNGQNGFALKTEDDQ